MKSTTNATNAINATNATNATTNATTCSKILKERSPNKITEKLVMHLCLSIDFILVINPFSPPKRLMMHPHFFLQLITSKHLKDLLLGVTL